MIAVLAQCRSHNECVGQQICSNGVCAAAIPVTGSQCNTDSQCPTSNACKFQMCWTLATSQRILHHLLFLQNLLRFLISAQCRNHNDCTGQQICSNTKCVAAVPIPNTQCTTDIQCASPSACKFQTCWTTAQIQRSFLV